MFQNMNQDLPITALCILTDRLKCPQNYTPIFKSYDANTEIDLWKDGLFGRKINRFICYTKDYPINETYNVIEDIKLLNLGENILGGFIPVDKCYDSTDKCFQKKVLCIKVSHRYFTSMAVSDIIVLVKSKRPPAGYSFIGEINNHIICVKFSAIPSGKQQAPQQPPHSQSVQQMSTGYPSQLPPPRPMSYGQNLSTTVEDGFIHVRPSPEPPATPSGSGDFYSSLTRGSSIVQTAYNPLQGVPFELNPMYDSTNTRNNFMDVQQLETKQNISNNLLERINYDFQLEKNLIESA